MSSAAIVCSRCDFACDKPRAGPCACKVDGVDILVHIERRDCPKGFHVNATEPEHEEPAPAIAVPREQWPFAARVIAKLATSDDKGVGDTIARLVDPRGGELFKRWYKRITGHDCGCEDAQARLNMAYPY